MYSEDFKSLKEAKERGQVSYCTIWLIAVNRCEVLGTQYLIIGKKWVVIIGTVSTQYL
jgi:hypothetical protein